MKVRPSFRADERGQDTIEWVLLALLVAVAAAAVVLTLGDTVRNGYLVAEECVSMANDGRGPPDSPPAGDGGRGPPKCRL